MCGISGIYSKSRINNLDERIDKMNLSIIHRGPDAGAHYINDKLALGHRRLSIIDTRDVSNQPMHTKSGIWHIVFNGEIYNFQEIKQHLNYSFKTLGDTEVIIAAVEEKGLNWFLEHANGMFAIALYNSITCELFLIRDRMGIKPLYYFNDGKNLIFSSEIKAILSSGLVRAKFNEKAVDEYLANRYVRAPYTFFENIYQLEPGTYIRIDKNFKNEQFTYWELPSEFNIEENYDEDKILEDFEQELTKAIKYRLIADVSLGTYLSGGIDSSIITAITALNKQEKVKTYTIGFKELNEFNYSKIIAEKYDTDHHEIIMDKEDYMANWEMLIKYKDAPLGVPNEIPLAVMSSKLKEKITVVLSGEGADELLGGYGKIFRLPFDYENHENHENGKSFYDTLIEKYEYVPRAMRDKLINTSKEYREEFDEKISSQFSHRTNEENIFNFFHSYHVKGLLQRVDMTTMQTSVEARVPFLDHNLIEFSYKSIPYDLKLRWKSEKDKELAKSQSANQYSEVLDWPKYILRKLSYKYLPKEIIERKKVGFPVPLTEWFDNLEELAMELLPQSPWLNKDAIDELIKDSRKENRAGQILWMFINIEIFRNNYFQNEWRW